MVSKKEIIKYLKSEGFEYIDNIYDAKDITTRSYFVEVISRSKIGWTHVFYNPKLDAILSFNCYFMHLYLGDNDYTCKLNKNNEKFIDVILSMFLEK